MPAVTFDTDVAQALRAHEDLENAIEGIEDAYEETAKAAAGLERAAARIVRANEGPQERYNRKIAELAKLHKAGKLSIEEANRAAERYRRTLERQLQAMNKTSGPQAQGQLQNMVRGYLSLGTAVNVGVQALQQLAAERKKAADEVKQSKTGLGALAQLAAVAEDPEAAMASMLAEARALFASGAAASVDEAGTLLFSLLSAGLDQADRKFAAELERSGAVTGIGEAASAFAALQKSLGTEEVGSFEDVISKALAASGGAPAKAPELVLAAAASGGSAKALGLSDEFLFAASEVLAAKTGSASVGGTQLAAFLKGIEAKGLAADKTLEGLSGLDLVEAIAAKNLDRAGLVNLLGDRQEAIEGFRALAENLPDLKRYFNEIDTASGRGVARTASQLYLGDQQLASGVARTQSENTLAVQSQQTMGTLANLVESARAELVQARRNDAMRGDRSSTGVELANLWEQFTVWGRSLEGTGGQVALLQEALKSGNLSPGLTAQIQAALSEQTGVLVQIRDSASLNPREE